MSEVKFFSLPNLATDEVTVIERPWEIKVPKEILAHPKEENKKAGELLKNGKIGLKELYNMDLPLKSKIKYTTLALFGATVHSRIYAALHKKLC